jgi:hypothetical protein
MDGQRRKTYTGLPRTELRLQMHPPQRSPVLLIRMRRSGPCFLIYIQLRGNSRFSLGGSVKHDWGVMFAGHNTVTHLDLENCITLWGSL